jgi:hypothetical protein
LSASITPIIPVASGKGAAEDRDFRFQIKQNEAPGDIAAG